MAAGSIQYDAHPLDSAPSPLLRALPAYEREFRGHLRRAQALQTVGAARLAAAEQLIAEMVGIGAALRFVLCALFMQERSWPAPRKLCT